MGYAPSDRTGFELELKMDHEWLSYLLQEFDSGYMRKLHGFLEREYKAKKVFPSPENIFRSLEATPLSKVKVIILGQDPYFNEGQANGLAFAVNRGVEVPPSLKNIFKEIESEYDKMPEDATLESWANQGVLLLNTTLTVRDGKANSHYGKGWEKFTDVILQVASQQKTPIVFMLWGKDAQEKRHLITSPNHLVLKTSHPSPLSVYQGFRGCGHFKEANEFLKKNGLTEIVWTD